jgi:hypothetical protein
MSWHLLRVTDRNHKNSDQVMQLSNSELNPGSFEYEAVVLSTNCDIRLIRYCNCVRDILSIIHKIMRN